VRQIAEQRIGGKATSVRRMPFGGLWEVLVDGELFYVDANVDYIIAGRVFDGRTREDLTERSREDLLRVDMKALPLDLAVKTVRGDGSRTMVTFEDPNCGYCKKLQHDMQTLTNVTIYTFLYPILSPDSIEKAKGVWCSKDQAQAWREIMSENKAPAAPAADCKAPVEQVVALGQKLGVNGTPTLFFADGRRVTGAVPMDRIEQRLVDAGKTVDAAKTIEAGKAAEAGKTVVR
jgi:thiol:disulfide interchange protein DsbC